MLRILLLSPYHGGSHLAFGAGLQKHSSHQISCLALPARFWKWRMRGAAMLLARQVRRLSRPPDLVLATDMMNLAEFRGLSGLGAVPHVVYFHENQLDYPVPENERQDFHFGFINLASALAAEAVIFNSRTHREAFFDAAPRLLKAMPDCPLPGLLEALRHKNRVIPVGCDLRLLRQTDQGAAVPDGPPLILWNHRWEFDKAPEVFFRVLDRLDRENIPFRLALAGENSQVEPKAFLQTRERYADRIVRFGWVPERDAYAALLRQADIVVSTARQENFGVAIVEAIACGAWPLLPRRLSYPEILPRDWHAGCLYEDEDDLARRLSRLLQEGLPDPGSRDALAASMLRYDWSALIGTYDDFFTGLANRPPT